MTAPPMLELERVSKRFGGHLVLDGLDLAVARGESLVVIGGSGTGKSVMLKCALGLLRPDSGRVRVDGADTAGLAPAARAALMRRFGMLFQGAALLDSLRVWENVAFAPMRSRGLDRAAARGVAEEKLAAVGLGPDAAELFPAELSGGMQKRVGLARAIAAEPDVLFFDEPTTGLDPIMADVINGLIVDCVRGLGATAVSITHDMASARKVADRVAMLHGGRIVWDGPVDAIDDSGDPYVDQFVHGRADGPIRTTPRGA